MRHVTVALAQAGGAPAPLNLPLAARSWQARSLAALLAKGVAQRPSIEARREHVLAERQVASRVSSLPDPQLEVGLSNFRFNDPALSGSAMTGLTFGLRQMLPFPGKLGRRGEVAAAGAGLAADSLALARTDVALQVRRAYWRLWTAEQVERLLVDTYRVLNELTNVIHARFAVGEAAEQDALQMQAVQSEVRSRLLEQRQARISAARALERAAGLTPDGLTRTDGAPPAQQQLARDKLVHEALENNPSLRISRQRVQVGRGNLDLARRERYPDFFVGAGYRLRAAAQNDPSEGADMFSVSLGVTLPIFIWRKQSAAVREWEHRVSADSASARDLELQVRTQLEQALDVLDRLDRQIALFAAEILPEDGAALDASVADYQVGRVALASVLQNWRSDIVGRIQLATLKGAHAEQLAVVHALLGDTGTPAVGHSKTTP